MDTTDAVCEPQVSKKAIKQNRDAFNSLNIDDLKFIELNLFYFEKVTIIYLS